MTLADKIADLDRRIRRLLASTQPDHSRPGQFHGPNRHERRRAAALARQQWALVARLARRRKEGVER